VWPPWETEFPRTGKDNNWCYTPIAALQYEQPSRGCYLSATRISLALLRSCVQLAVSSGIGGEVVTENIEGRERYPINVRYNRDFRDNVEELRRVLVATPSGAQIPIEQVAKISFSRGPAMIRDEEGP
jgi:Cu/Ag efflux pump CusA